MRVIRIPRSPIYQENNFKAEKKISGFGRLLVRKSGTEKLIRIMVEAEDASVIDATMSSSRSD